MEDIRKGLPSASAMNRYFKCVGSYMLEKGMPDNAGEDAKLGTKRHEMIEHNVDSFDNEEDEYMVTRAKQLGAEAIAECGIGLEDEVEKLVEERIWLYDEKLNQIFSGQIDEGVICQAKSVGVVLDWKLVGAGHAEATQNEQSISNSVLLASKYKLDTVYTAIIQPASEAHPVTICKLDKDALAMAEDRLRLQLRRIMHEDALSHLDAGSHCKWCKYGTRCQTAAQHNALTVITPMDPDRPASVELLDKIALAKKMLSDLESAEKAKAIAQLENDPDSLPGYKISTKKTTSTDAQKAWPKLVAHLQGIEIAGAMKLSIPQLVKPFKESMERKPENGKVTLKKARMQLDELLADCSVTKESDPFLKKV